MSDIDDKLLDVIADSLVDPGYIVLEQVIPGQLLNSLLLYFDHLHQFMPAGIGRNDNFQLQEAVRSDSIYWLDNTFQPGDAQSQLLSWMNSLRIGINRRLFLGLADYESHFASYEIGAFYKKHKDAFKGDVKKSHSNRKLSTVLYLNREWDKTDGGELLIYSEDDAQQLEKISPTFGKLVIFLSEKFPHEVLPAGRKRKSIAGWFRVNNA